MFFYALMLVMLNTEPRALGVHWLPGLLVVFGIGQIPFFLILWPAIRTRHAQGTLRPNFKLVEEPDRDSQSPLHDDNASASTEVKPARSSAGIELGSLQPSPQVNELHGVVVVRSFHRIPTT